METSELKVTKFNEQVVDNIPSDGEQPLLCPTQIIVGPMQCLVWGL